jgi:isopentenyl diphosphate isomerase/L-lactate dehydrogenase-like FMN-dependent dehydrogenase
LARDLSAELLGEKPSLPVVLGPVGRRQVAFGYLPLLTMI